MLQAGSRVGPALALLDRLQISLSWLNTNIIHYHSQTWSSDDDGVMTGSLAANVPATM